MLPGPVPVWLLKRTGALHTDASWQCLVVDWIAAFFEFFPGRDMVEYEDKEQQQTR
jgi:hypothetical protein